MFYFFLFFYIGLLAFMVLAIFTPPPPLGGMRVYRRRDFRLLWRWLTWRQRWSLLRHKYFNVIGHDGVIYSLMIGYNYNVMNASGVVYCFMPIHVTGDYRFGVPIYDQLLAQKLLLETSGVPIVAFVRQTLFNPSVFYN